jgi:hypothetical protein
LQNRLERIVRAARRVVERVGEPAYRLFHQLREKGALALEVSVDGGSRNADFGRDLVNANGDEPAVSE